MPCALVRNPISRTQRHSCYSCGRNAPIFRSKFQHTLFCPFRAMPVDHIPPREFHQTRTKICFSCGKEHCLYGGMFQPRVRTHCTPGCGYDLSGGENIMLWDPRGWWALYDAPLEVKSELAMTISWQDKIKLRVKAWENVLNSGADFIADGTSYAIFLTVSKEWMEMMSARMKEIQDETPEVKNRLV